MGKKSIIKAISSMLVQGPWFFLEPYFHSIQMFLFKIHQLGILYIIVNKHELKISICKQITERPNISSACDVKKNRCLHEHSDTFSHSTYFANEKRMKNGKDFPTGKVPCK